MEFAKKDTLIYHSNEQSCGMIGLQYYQACLEIYNLMSEQFERARINYSSITKPIFARCGLVVLKCSAT